MPLYAHDSETGQVVALRAEGALELAAATREGRYRCLDPDCRAVFSHTRDTGRGGHDCFVHPVGPGRCAANAESDAHLAAKQLLGQHLGNLVDPGWSVQVDSSYLPGGQRRPDVAVLNGQGTIRVAYELQLAALTAEQWQCRHDDYRDAGVVDRWLFGGALYSRVSELGRHIVAVGEPLWLFALDEGSGELAIGVATGRDVVAVRSGGVKDRLSQLGVHWAALAQCGCSEGLLGVRAHDELEAFLGDLGNGLGEQYQRFCDNGGGRVRVAQRTMVARLTGAVLGGEHMVAQAPTGTGKSYAYLLAAALSGRRTLVSTSSKELQRQLTEPGRDIAVVGEFSSWLGAWQTAMLQGRSNYLCARRVAEAEGEGAELGALKDWDEVHRGVPLVEAGKLGKTKWSLSISSEECAGRECSHFNECSYEEAKARAIAADVVVVNHDLLAYLAMGEHPVLASRELVVIDEAHDLVERTRAALARALSGAGLRRLATQAANLGITDGVVQLRAVADELEQALAGVRSDLRCDWRLFGGALGSVLAKLESVLGELVRTPRPGGCELADWERWMEQVKSRVPLVEAVSSPDEDHYTYIEGQGQGISLQLGVVEVSRFLSGLLFGRVPCVLTSATLSVDGSFDWLIERSGVGLGTRAVRQLMLGSPFALDEHVDLYIPGPGSPSPRDEGEGWREWSTTTTLELVKASRGGALVLTTSTARVAELAGALRGIFGERVMSQQTGAGTAGLSSWLGEQSDRILVATRSLWQGVDIPGPALRLLIIDRIPFEPRDSPLARALERRVGSRAAFLEYSLPAAALVLAQGAGRLIRREDDRGVVAVLDCRVWQWGELRAALPVVPDMALHSDLKRILMRLESRAELVVEAGVQQP